MEGSGTGSARVREAPEARTNRSPEPPTTQLSEVVSHRRRRAVARRVFRYQIVQTQAQRGEPSRTPGHDSVICRASRRLCLDPKSAERARRRLPQWAGRRLSEAQRRRKHVVAERRRGRSVRGGISGFRPAGVALSHDDPQDASTPSAIDASWGGSATQLGGSRHGGRGRTPTAGCRSPAS